MGIFLSVTPFFLPPLYGLVSGSARINFFTGVVGGEKSVFSPLLPAPAQLRTGTAEMNT